MHYGSGNKDILRNIIVFIDDLTIFVLLEIEINICT